METRMVMKLASVAACLELKRMSYALQLLKQFYLFPEESESSQRTVSKYDALIFDDQLLHAMVRKLETKLIENKIWGFINLKTHRYLQHLHTLSRNIKKLTRRVHTHHQAVSFHLIKTYSYTRTTTTRLQITEGSAPGRGRLMTAVGGRSRSGSIIRYEYDTDSANRILLNGQIIPCKIEVRRSVSPMKEPEYIKISKPTQHQDIRYIGLTRQQLQKKQNLDYEYQHPNANAHSRSRVICVQRATTDQEDTHLCTHCRPPSGAHCLPPSSPSPSPSPSPSQPNSQKVIRLRSSKKLANYSEHLA